MNPFLPPSYHRFATLPWLREIDLAPGMERYHPYAMTARVRAYGDFPLDPVRRRLDFSDPPTAATSQRNAVPPSVRYPLLRRAVSTRDAATHTTTYRPDTRTLGVQCTLLPEELTEEEERELLSMGEQEEKGTDAPDLEALFKMCEQAALYSQVEGQYGKLCPD